MRSCSSPRGARTIRCSVAHLQPLVGAIPVELMREANYRVDRDTDM
jgi:osmoprotectant transport system permease protein